MFHKIEPSFDRISAMDKKTTCFVNKEFSDQNLSSIDFVKLYILISMVRLIEKLKEDKEEK